jgi:tetratricopeptide (TPR) repeat protein
MPDARRLTRPRTSTSADAGDLIRLNPASAWAHALRATSYRATGDLDAAIADYSETLRLDADYFAIHYERGILYRMKGDRERAIADFRESMQRYPFYCRGLDARIAGAWRRASLEAGRARPAEVGTNLPAIAAIR